MDDKEIRVKWNLDFRFKNLKGKEEDEKIYPAFEMLAEYLVRQASDSREKRAKFFNWGMKLMDQKCLEVTKSEVETIMDSLNSTNMSNIYWQQLDETATSVKDQWDEMKKKAKEQKA